MNEAVKLLETLGKMCKGNDCVNCPLSHSKNGTGDNCDKFLRTKPEKAVAIIEAWGKAHKTYLEDFLEKYPNAPMENDNVPCVCRTVIYVSGNLECGNCAKCWGEIMGVQE